MALFELMQSIEKEGVIVPALARPKAGGGYELIAMVDSNLQREHLKPSEKAFAYLV